MRPSAIPAGIVAALVLAGAPMAIHSHGAAAPLPAIAAAVLKARFPTLRVLSQAIGPLHAEGARDVVVVLGQGERGARIVAVLWEQAGAYRFANASGDIDAACPGCEIGVRIRERALEVGSSNPGDDTVDVRGWRFVYRGARGNVLRLVGVRHERIVHAGGDAAIDVTAATDLLTGDKADTIERRDHGRLERREARERIALRQPILFEQFAFDVRDDAPETRFVFGRDGERQD